MRKVPLLYLERSGLEHAYTSNAQGANPKHGQNSVDGPSNPYSQPPNMGPSAIPMSIPM